LVLIVLAVVVAVTARRDDREAQPPSRQTSPQASRLPRANEPFSNEIAQPTTTDTQPQPQQTSEVPATDPKPIFRTNAAGQLQLDEQTRLGIEALFALTSPAELEAAKQSALLQLPSAAATRASDLLEDYANYQEAQRQAYPPGNTPATVDTAIAELDGLHALRAAHFGDSVAEALYGTEERHARSIIELMRLEQDQSLTMEEKVHRAQQLRDRLPDIRAIERANTQQQ
jgi:hypothetical protein